METSSSSFSGWLRRIAGRAGASSPPALRRLLAEHGCACSAEAVRAWWAGEDEPSPDKARAIIRALGHALPQVSVWDDYASYLEGGGPEPERPPEETLDEILKKSPGLPPGL